MNLESERKMYQYSAHLQQVMRVQGLVREGLNEEQSQTHVEVVINGVIPSFCLYPMRWDHTRRWRAQRPRCISFVVSTVRPIGALGCSLQSFLLISCSLSRLIVIRIWATASLFSSIRVIYRYKSVRGQLL